MIDILIPTCKPTDQLGRMVSDIANNTNTPHRILVSGLKESASINRNWCLDRCTTDPAIMLDDDITGFYFGWEQQLISPLREDDTLCAVSARLMRPDGKIAQTCSRDYDLTQSWAYVTPSHECVMPTAAISFHPLPEVRFDEAFQACGWEDGDWFFQYLRLGRTFAQSNECRLIHLNEMKGQRDSWTFNKNHFYSKWVNVSEGQ